VKLVDTINIVGGDNLLSRAAHRLANGFLVRGVIAEDSGQAQNLCKHRTGEENRVKIKKGGSGISGAALSTI
jgi:hypothetical protein